MEGPRVASEEIGVNLERNSRALDLGVTNLSLVLKW